jgi:prepilin-type N-terminal cleavage/methylation domain-containing protein
VVIDSRFDDKKATTRLGLGSGRGRGYTLIEILVVAAISLMLMTVIAYIYSNSLRVYQETQGLSTVYETAKLINRDMRNTLGFCVPVPGNAINPQTLKFPGLPDATPATLDPWYLDTKGGSDPDKAVWMTNDENYDLLFSGSQFRFKTSGWSGLSRGWPPFDNMTYWGYNYNYWQNGASNGNYGLRSYWMPAFFGRRDFNSAVKTLIGNSNVLACNNVLAGSWGWPRADYRMDVDMDMTTRISPKPLINSTANNPTIACWFYAENRSFNSPFTLSLDNPNIMLVSWKFSYVPPQPAQKDLKGNITAPARGEVTQLTMLRHSIGGFDLADAQMLRSDQTMGSMLRAIKITPYTIDNGNKIVEMDDVMLNSKIANGAPQDVTRAYAGFKIGGQPSANLVPRFFDIEYALRNPYSQHRYNFALRVYCPINPQ